MNSRKYLIAMDVGGTNTRIILFADDGEIIKKSVTRGGTPLDFGIDNMLPVYRDGLLEISKYAPGPIAACYVSIATLQYYGTRIYDYLRESLPFGVIRAEDDGPCLISGMLGHNDGCCLICGTGSAFYIRKGEDYHHLGGWGYLIDSCGSGYVLGARAVRAAVRAKDGRRPATLLNGILHKKLGHPIEDDFITLYRGGRAYIAGFAECLFEARELGDPIAIRIYDECAQDLAELVWTGYHELGDKPFDVVFNGGIFAHHKEYADTVKAMSPSAANIIYPDVPPVYGGAAEAMYDLGLVAGADFKRKFLEGLGEW